jgi:uncharacterized protein YeeX (DUF496 family)
MNKLLLKDTIQEIWDNQILQKKLNNNYKSNLENFARDSVKFVSIGKSNKIPYDNLKQFIKMQLLSNTPNEILNLITSLKKDCNTNIYNYIVIQILDLQDTFVS